MLQTLAIRQGLYKMDRRAGALQPPLVLSDNEEKRRLILNEC